ncbi:hypothetical protein [Mycolicibacterium sp. A43C]
MSKCKGTTVIYLGYVSLLVGFLCLGVTVAALAARSPWFIAAAGGMVGSLITAVIAVRKGLRRGVSGLWAEKRASGDVDRYLASYRGESRSTPDATIDAPALTSRAA